MNILSAKHRELHIYPTIQKWNVPMKMFISQNDIKQKCNYHSFV